MREPTLLIDSPWFWALVFSLMALLALAAIGGKYGRRQATIERNYQARERVAEKLTAENNPGGEKRIDYSDARHSYATPDNKLIPIWPLAVLLGLISLVAAVMLYRGRGRPGSLDLESSSP
jgi:hypothetical protein